jgi:hypothetical protein
MNIEELEKKANPGAFSSFDIEVLVPEVQKLQPGEIYLEVGVDRGRSLSIARMVAKEGVKVIGVDLREDPKVPETIFLRGDSVEVSETWQQAANGALISVLFIDGDHSYEGCKRDIEAWYPYMQEGGVILFHDCDETSPGVVQAVAEAYLKYGKDWQLFKRTDKNTSMAKIQL